MFSSPKATSFATLAITAWSSGSWKTDATVPTSRAGSVSRVSAPPTTTRPAKTPPWKCGTSPAIARRSVDFPEPDGAEQRDVLALAELERDAVEHRRAGT